MTLHHHPDDDLLLPMAAGRLPAGQSVLVSTHLESCVQCRARLHDLQAVGGALLEDSEPQALAPDAWARTLARIDGESSAETIPATTAPPRPSLPSGMGWPSSLRDAQISRWRWMAPGMRFARVRLSHDPEATLFLLRIGAGRHLPRHTHRGLELTQVLHGSFDDGRAVFSAADFDAADSDVHHQPVVTRDGECICLAYVGGSLRFDGRVAGLLGGMIGM